jgi:S-adenosylmethionine synthetase
MGLNRYLLASESVTEGHPDKLADQISDAVLDAVLEQDSNGRVAAETLITNGLVLLTGEISTSARLDIPGIARAVIKDAGYTRPEYGIDGGSCAVITTLAEQSPDIAQGVNLSLETRCGQSRQDDLDLIGAGDQGLVFGYATNETPEFMPLSIILAHRLTKRLAEIRKRKMLPYLRPDGKSQVTIEYENNKPIRVDTVVISAQHDPDVELEQLRNDIIALVLKPTIPDNLLDGNTRYYINPTGRFVIGGPRGDGGQGHHGGGALSGKNFTKVDRSGAYAASMLPRIS